jgi:hypothetical protein
MYVSVGDLGNKMEDFSKLWVLLRRHPHRLTQATRVRETLRVVLRGSQVQSNGHDLNTNYRMKHSGKKACVPRFLFVVEIFTLYKSFGDKLKSSHASSMSEAMAPARLARLAYSCVL